MPKIIYENESIEDKPLQLEFNLLSIESPKRWEGWIYYDLSLSSGEDKLAAISHGSIEYRDVKYLISILESPMRAQFAPMEPDFHLYFNPSVKLDLTSGHHEPTEVLIFIDEGVRRSLGIYTGAGIGIRMLVTKKALKAFSEELMQQYKEITKGLTKIP